MVGDFFGWIFGALLLLAVFVYVLDFLGLVGIVEAVGALVSLAASVIGMLAALLIWSARKLDCGVEGAGRIRAAAEPRSG
jgi:hypothetical protein